MTQLLNSEKQKYTDIYTQLVFATDDLKQILDESELNKRTFIIKLDALKDYMNFLDKLESDCKPKKGFLSNLLKQKPNLELEIHSYLTPERKIKLSKLSKCANCKCISCINNCPMNHCINCRQTEFVSNCDTENTLLTLNDDTITLYNNGEPVVFNLEATLIEKDSNNNFSRYVYLIDRNNNDNHHILQYSKFKGEERYDSVIVDDSQDELIRINDKFISLGLIV